MLQQGEVAAVIVAAGRSRRMGFDKLFYRIGGVEVLRRAVMQFDSHPLIDKLVVVAGENQREVQRLFEKYPTGKPLVITRGGEVRAVSVAAGLAACGTAYLVAIHDGARPFVSADIISRTIAEAAEIGAAAPAIPLKDTVKQLQNGFVEATPPRSALAAVQTPQVFQREVFAAALADIPPEEYPALTDDCMVMERAGLPVRLVEGEEANRKITTAADLPEEEGGRKMDKLRIGHGYDVHRFAENRRLILGGVDVPYEKGLLGHSDADVLLHAVADALLGAAALGDIGRHFPDSDPAYKNADSFVLLEKTADIVKQAGWTPVNIDATLLCQAPKLAPHIPAMRANIAKALGVERGTVSVKATTEEGLGFTGKGEGIAAHCVVLLRGV